MVTFCDILHEAKQKTKANSRECAVRTGNQHVYVALIISQTLWQKVEHRNYKQKNMHP